MQYLDEVAVDAFHVVQRFPNPPPGLMREDGTVKLPFAFTLLAATGGIRLQVGPAYVTWVSGGARVSSAKGAGMRLLF